jgi:hypothetical protein
MNACEFSTCLLMHLIYIHSMLYSALLVGRLPASRFLREQRSLREHSTPSDSGYHRSLGVVYIHQQHFDDRRYSVQDHVSETVYRFCVKIPNVVLRWINRAVGRLRKNGSRVSTTRKYNTAIRAMIESAFVTWLGILILEITSLAPTGHVTVRSHVPQNRRAF